MSTNLKGVLLMSVGVLLLSFSCAGISPTAGTPAMREEEPPSTIPSPEPADIMKAPAPRTLASLRLTEQAQVLIESKKPDEAIRILEQSLNMDPHNGRNYYFLAEAWILKGNAVQAMEFNRLAEMYLGEDEVWKDKVQRQKEQIETIYEK